METRKKLEKQADVLFEQKEYEKAINFYGQAVELGSSSSLIRRGDCFELMRQEDNALKDYEKAVTLPDCNDKFDELYTKIAKIYLKKNMLSSNLV